MDSGNIMQIPRKIKKNNTEDIEAKGELEVIDDKIQKTVEETITDTGILKLTNDLFTIDMPYHFFMINGVYFVLGTFVGTIKMRTDNTMVITGIPSTYLANGIISIYNQKNHHLYSGIVCSIDDIISVKISNRPTLPLDDVTAIITFRITLHK